MTDKISTLITNGELVYTSEYKFIKLINDQFIDNIM